MSDSNEFFSTPEVSAHLDLIRHLIENSELVPLVKGPAGAGKSLMASKLQQSAPDNWVVCHFSAEPALQPERLLAFIARCSGLPDMAGDLMQRLADRFEVLRKRGRIPVLLIDDAQMLPPTSLITLLRLFERQVEGARLVSIVLFADEQIDLLLSTPQLQVMTPQAIQAIDMPHLTLQEVSGFMHFLLKNEGLSDQFNLDESKLSRLHKETEGVPGPLANAILREVGQFGGSKQPLLSGYRKQLILLGLPVLSVVLLLLLFQGPINALFESAEVEPGPLSSVSDTDANRIDLPAPAESASGIEVEEPLEADFATSEDAGPEIVSLTDPVPPMSKPSIADELTDGSVVVEPPEQKPDSEPVSVEPSKTETPSPQVIDSPGKNYAEKEIIQGEAVAMSSPEKVPVDVSETSEEVPAPEELSLPPDEDMKQEVVAEKPQQKVQAPTEVTTTVDDSEQTSTQVVHKEGASTAMEWVSAQPPENYTLQLIAVENISSLERFKKANNLDNQAYTVKTQRNGSPWYSLVWGSFESRELALKAQTRLAPAIQKSGVWARTFASIIHRPGD